MKKETSSLLILAHKQRRKLSPLVNGFTTTSSEIKGRKEGASEGVKDNILPIHTQKMTFLSKNEMCRVILDKEINSTLSTWRHTEDSIFYFRRFKKKLTSCLTL